LKRAALKAAAQWHAQLCSDDATAGEREAWAIWHAAHETHRWAWQQVELLRGRIQQQREKLPEELAASTFHLASTLPKLRVQRRTVLKTCVFALFGGVTAWGTLHRKPDYQTATGEQQEITLADGTTLLMNSDSAVVINFDAQQRLVRLQRGEIYIRTAKENLAAGEVHRPFIVQTAQGRIRALGTRFTVRQGDERSHVAVLESAVEISPSAAARGYLLHAGEQAEFSTRAVQPLESDYDGDPGWIAGMVVATDWRLADLVTELARYRPGILVCTSEVADLRISGTFPIKDSELALKAIAKALPVQIVQRTRYWVTLAAAG